MIPKGSVAVSSCHDEPDIPRLAGLEVHVHGCSVLVEIDIAPFRLANLADAESSFLEHHNKGPVNILLACFHDRDNFIRSEKVSCDLSHGVLGQCLHIAMFVLGGVWCSCSLSSTCKTVWAYEPSRGWYSVCNRSQNGSSTSQVQSSLHRYQRWYWIHKRSQDLSPTNKSVDDFVGSAQRDVITGLLFDHEFPHQGNVPLSDGPGFEGFVNGVCGIMFFNWVKRDSFWNNPRSRNHDPKRGSLYKCLLEDSNFLSESRRRDLNPRPADYESAAIPLSHGGNIPHNIDLLHY